MKAILALDGSPTSETAADLVAALRWPAGSEIRLVAAFDLVGLMGPWATFASYDVDGLMDDMKAELHTLLEASGERLRGSGAALVQVVAEGRPSGVITEMAREVGAELIVVGSRGQGPLRTLLLGSVSAEVVDQAACPALVVRRPTIGRILLAHDGSTYARAAEDVSATWPLLRGLPIEVMSVVRGGGARGEELAPLAEGRVAVAVRESIEEARRHHEDIARSAAERLALGGREVRAEVRAGDPAGTLVDEAEARGIDLIVLGTHGRTGLERLRLGSVARKVLTHAHCSVLVVPPPSRGSG